MVAARTGDAALIRLFLARGARIEARDSLGFTPLLLAAEAGNVATVQALLAAGADPQAVDGNGRNALAIQKVKKTSRHRLTELEHPLKRIRGLLRCCRHPLLLCFPRCEVSGNSGFRAVEYRQTAPAPRTGG